MCEGETALRPNEEGEPWDGRDQSIVFQMAVSFHLACAEGVSRICLSLDILLCSCCVDAFPVQWLP